MRDRPSPRPVAHRGDRSSIRSQVSDQPATFAAGTSAATCRAGPRRTRQLCFEVLEATATWLPPTSTPSIPWPGPKGVTRDSPPVGEPLCPSRLAPPEAPTPRPIRSGSSRP